MGERYDVLVTLKDGVFPLVAPAEGKKTVARGLIRSSDRMAAPCPGLRPRELDGEVIGYDQLVPREALRG